MRSWRTVFWFFAIGTALAIIALVLMFEVGVVVGGLKLFYERRGFFDGDGKTYTHAGAVAVRILVAEVVALAVAIPTALVLLRRARSTARG